jgi:hypothetical protein
MVDLLKRLETAEKVCRQPKVTPPNVKLVFLLVRLLGHAPPHLVLADLLDQGILGVR